MTSDKKQLEEGSTLSPRYNSDGLIAAIAVDDAGGEVLMLAWMNETALMKTLETGEVHYWSRSRGELWHKGASSGNVQQVVSIHIDCDQDAIVLRVRQQGYGAACHTGRKSCFYRRVEMQDGKPILADDGGNALFDPDTVYHDC